jgi:alpha-beta hydrolase superfamily lysophospholipase
MGFDTQTTLASPTGAALHLYVKQASGAARGVVHVCHGFAEHAARYARFAEALSQAGFHVYAHDHRGHGLTRAPDAPQGRLAAKDGWRLVLADVDAVHARIAEEHPGLPLILLGHSMGGLIALNSVLSRSDHLAGAAIWNANFSAGLLGRLGLLMLAWEKFRLGSDMPSRLAPKLTFEDWGKKIPGAMTPADWLSRDPAEVRKYIDDPLCGWNASVSMWQDVFALVFRGADDHNFSGVRKDLPFNLVGGGKDPATDGGKAVEALAARLRAMGFSNLVSTVYPDTRHESLNEVNRDAITADFVAWANAVASG